MQEKNKDPQIWYVVIDNFKRPIKCVLETLEIPGEEPKMVYVNPKTSTIYRTTDDKIFGPYTAKTVDSAIEKIKEYKSYCDKTSFYITTETKENETITQVSRNRMYDSKTISQEEAFVMVIHRTNNQLRASLCSKKITEFEGQTKEEYITLSGSETILPCDILEILKIEKGTYYDRGIDLRNSNHVRKVEQAGKLAYLVNFARKKDFHVIEYSTAEGKTKKTIGYRMNPSNEQIDITCDVPRGYNDYKQSYIPETVVKKTYPLDKVISSYFELYGMYLDITDLSDIDKIKGYLDDIRKNPFVFRYAGGGSIRYLGKDGVKYTGEDVVRHYSEKRYVVHANIGNNDSTLICRDTGNYYLAENGTKIPYEDVIDIQPLEDAVESVYADGQKLTASRVKAKVLKKNS